MIPVEVLEACNLTYVMTSYLCEHEAINVQVHAWQEEADGTGSTHDSKQIGKFIACAGASIAQVQPFNAAACRMLLLSRLLPIESTDHHATSVVPILAANALPVTFSQCSAACK